MRTFEAHFAWCREDPDRSRFIFALFFFGPPANGLMAEMEKFKGRNELRDDRDRRARGTRRVVDPDRAEAFGTACRGLIIISIMDFLYKHKDLGPGLAERLVGNLLGGFQKPAGPAESLTMAVSRWWFALGGSGAASLALVLAGCGHSAVESKAKAETAPKPIPVTVAPLELRPVERTVEVVGTLNGWGGRHCRQQEPGTRPQGPS